MELISGKYGKINEHYIRLEYSMGLKVVEWDFIQCCLVGFRLVYQDLQPSIYVICGFEVV